MKHIILTERDNKILSFLEEYKCATTSTVASIFFNGSRRPCSRRLQHLREHKFITSSQEFVALEQIHYIGKKPSQLRHSCITTNLLAKLHEQDIQIIKSLTEYKVSNVRADMLLVLNVRGKNYIYFVEICNTKKFDLHKYIKLYEGGEWKGRFPVFPSIMVISDKPVDTHDRFDMKIFNTKLNEFRL